MSSEAGSADRSKKKKKPSPRQVSFVGNSPALYVSKGEKGHGECVDNRGDRGKTGRREREKKHGKGVGTSLGPQALYVRGAPGLITLNSKIERARATNQEGRTNDPKKNGRGEDPGI